MLLVVPARDNAAAENARVAERRAAQRIAFTDDEIISGFMLTAIGAEFQISGRGDRIRKYEAPVRVFIDNRGAPDRTALVKRVVADIALHVRHIDIAVTPHRARANLVVTLLRQRAFFPKLAEIFGHVRAREIRRRLDPQCLSGFRKDADFRIQHSDVILVTDIGEFDFLDCAYEEVLQALGPINDTDKVPWTMFNDDVQMGFFDIYDQYIMNILYDPRVRPGMSAADVRAVIPQVLPSVREWVARVNGLPPELSRDK
jgi:hypothetical protein